MKNLVFHEMHQKARLSNKEVNEALKDFGLYSAQWSILFCLKRFGIMTQTEIWQYLNVEAPTVTRTLVKLEQRNFIIRKEGKDKRERIVELTEEAMYLIPKIEGKIAEVEGRLLQSLSDDEVNELTRLLKKLGKDYE
ncbi:MarR family transcriptional regulator [Paenisporosarcina sp. FSL H8-0542]|uniref:MarR family winged helix-turn-helix transcriptional regulator n=1 Tax=Paenisporosarcina sp. FSL H8-0542 TaxID=2921401 RepID=UPI00315AEE10